MLFFVIAIIVTLITLKFTTNILQKTTVKENSLKEGFGYYSDPIKTSCLNIDGSKNCNQRSTYKIINHCIPHPITKNGCLGHDGTRRMNLKFKNYPVIFPVVIHFLGNKMVYNYKKYQMIFIK